MKAICEDLSNEQQSLDDIVANLDDAGWSTVTPFYGWTVKDEISHLAYFDFFAKLSASDKAAFDVELAKLAEDYDNLFPNTMAPGRSKTNAELLKWWREERIAMVDAYRLRDPKDRLPWHIPMSARSSATARLMETWAHGQDVADALGIRRQPTDRLKHIAHLGAVTINWSFTCRGEDAPSDPIRIEINSPSGEIWTWGEEGAENLVSGSAEDFCLVVTQRRHYGDTSLTLKGDVAERWMSIAQCFAGPPADGPKAGKFPKR